jgi:PAS domain S-box-containing protein
MDDRPLSGCLYYKPNPVIVMAYNQLIVNNVEEQVIREKELSDHIINSMPGIFYLFDHTGKFLRWNKNLETTTGYSAKEISRMAPHEFFIPDHQDLIRDRLDQLFQAGSGKGAWTMQTRDGTAIPHYFTSEAILFEGKLCMLGTGIDMTEQKEAEERSRISNERYKLATRATNDVIWEWDIISETLFWGEAFYEQFGYKPGKRTQTRAFWETRIHPEERSRVVNSITKFISDRKQGVWLEEYRSRKAGGKYVLVSARGFLVFDQHGKMTRVIGALQDISEKRKMEKALMKKEINKQKVITSAVVDAQEKDRAKIGRELHDNISQILTTTRLYLELARTDLKDRLMLINRSADSIQTAINEIRNISRSLVAHSIEDLGLGDSIYDLVQNINDTKAIRVKFHMARAIEARINDKYKLMIFRIIQEQVNNVLKHSGARILHIELIWKKKEGWVELNITDDGKGFNPRRAKNRKGLGLSNIMSRVDLIGGKFHIDSAAGKGCRLKITIPV